MVEHDLLAREFSDAAIAYYQAHNADGRRQKELDAAASRLTRIARDLIESELNGKEILKVLLEHDDPYVRIAAAIQAYSFDQPGAERVLQSIADERAGMSSVQAHRALRNLRLPREAPASPVSGRLSETATEGKQFLLSDAIVESIMQSNFYCDLAMVSRFLFWKSIRLLNCSLESSSTLSRIGGTPLVPQDFLWPRNSLGAPMAFIAQVQLSDEPSLRPYPELPTRGSLCFFHDLDALRMADDEDAPSDCVVFFVDTSPELRRVDFPLDIAEEFRFREIGIQQVAENTLPPPDLAPMAEEPGTRLFRWSRAASEQYASFTDAFETWRGSQDQLLHRMFGFPDDIQGPMALAVERELGDTATDEDRWRLLLQIEVASDLAEPDALGIRWGPGGRLFFWIKRTELLNRRFDDVRAVFQHT